MHRSDPAAQQPQCHKAPCIIGTRHTPPEQWQRNSLFTEDRRGRAVCRLLKLSWHFLQWLLHIDKSLPRKHRELKAVGGVAHIQLLASRECVNPTYQNPCQSLSVMWKTRSCPSGWSALCPSKHALCKPSELLGISAVKWTKSRQKEPRFLLVTVWECVLSGGSRNNKKRRKTTERRSRGRGGGLLATAPSKAADVELPSLLLVKKTEEPLLVGVLLNVTWWPI